MKYTSEVHDLSKTHIFQVLSRKLNIYHVILIYLKETILSILSVVGEMHKVVTMQTEKLLCSLGFYLDQKLGKL